MGLEKCTFCRLVQRSCFWVGVEIMLFSVVCLDIIGAINSCELENELSGHSLESVERGRYSKVAYGSIEREERVRQVTLFPSKNVAIVR